ncbi:MAG: cupin domain-containing protein [Candidatus Zixiibacteriota bacterium]
MRRQALCAAVVLSGVVSALLGSYSQAATVTVGSPGAAVVDIDSLLAMNPLGSDQPYRSDVIAWDSASSMHLTQVQGVMESHRHLNHEENVWIIRGAGRLTLGTEKIRVMAGQVIHIPRNTPHAFANLGSSPAVVISVFAPAFDGKDRVYDTTPKTDGSAPVK